MAISTNGAIITRLAGALYNEYLSNASYTELSTTAPATVATNFLSNDFAGKTDAQIATTVLTNLSLNTVAGLDNWVAAQLTAAGSTAAAKGAKLVSMLNDYANMTADATYGASATSFNSKVSAALVLSQTDGSAGGAFATAGTAPVSGGTFALSTGTDTADSVSASRGTANSAFKFTSGNETISGSIGTLGDNDILLDDTTTDADVLNVNGGTGTFTSTNIESINLTTATAATLQLDKVSGATNVNITGTNTVTVDGFAADTFQPTFGVNNITRIVTLSPATFNGAAVTGDAEALNVSVSGLSYGTSSSKQSGITLDGATDGILETLNLTSTGATTNDFALAFDSGDSVTAMNIKGDQSVQIRTASAAVSGVTISATENTGTATLRVDVNGLTMAATNAANWTGVDNILLVDSTAGTDFGVVSAMPDASKVTFGSTFNATVTSTNFNSLSVQGATFTTLKNSVTVELDNVATIAAGVTLGKLDVQNVKALNLASSGHASSSSSTGANVVNDLTGDFTTITITGDTSLDLDLNIDATETATTTSARTVVVNASGMTGDSFVTLAADTNTKVGYNITGTANADSITLNTTAGTVASGAGDDSITGGDGNDTIGGGDGDDTITISYGTDAVTGGAGNDTFTAIAADGAAAAVAQVTTSGDLDGGLTIVAAQDDLVVTVNGAVYKLDLLTDGDTADDIVDDFIAAYASTILAAHNVTITASDAASASDAATLIFTGKSDGTSFTADVTISDNGTAVAVTETTSPAGAAAKDVNTSITDFEAGDVINLASLLTSTGVYHEGAAGDAAAGDSIFVLTAVAYATAAEAQAAIDIATTGDDGVIVFLNSTLGKAQMIFDNDTDLTTDTPNVIFTFDNITTLTGLATVFTEDNFIIS
jgi:hypothetical protein